MLPAVFELEPAALMETQFGDGYSSSSSNAPTLNDTVLGLAEVGVGVKVGFAGIDGDATFGLGALLADLFAFPEANHA